MYRNLLLAIACIASFSTQAQDSNNINSDNTGYTMSPQTVGKKALQIEAGYTYFSGNIKFSEPNPLLWDNYFTTVKRTTNAAALKLRYGIFERFEVSAQYGSLITNSRAEFSSKEPNDGKYHTDYFGFAIKGLILKGAGLIPAVGASVEYSSRPYGGENIRANLAAESRLFEKMGVRVNLGCSTEEYAHIGIQVNYSISDHWKVFGEYSGNLGDNNWMIASLEDFSYYQPSNTTAGLVWNINSSALFGLSGTYYINSRDAIIGVDKVQNMALNISFNKRFDWGK